MSNLTQTMTDSRKYAARWLFLAALLLPATSLAETLYVGDKLRVGVRANPSSKAPALTIISSGTAVEVLQRKQHFLKVRTPNGTIGWVKSAYFSSQKPARLQLREIEAQLQQREHELRSLQAQYQDKQRQLEQLSQRLASAEETNRLLQRQQQGATSTSVTPATAQALDKNALGIAGASMAGVLALGFVLGIWWHRRAVARRLGGITL